MKNIIIEKPQAGVTQVTLNRPAKHNAFDDQVITELTQALQAIKADPDCRVLILAATGKSFSAGADIQWMQRMCDYSEAENVSDAQALGTLLLTLNTLPQATIAKVQGSAFGGGVGLVACCDMAVAVDTVSFCFSETRIGLIPATISPFVVEAIGARAARRYFLTAESFNAQQAVKIGLVHQVVTAEQLDQACDKLVNKLLQNSPAAITASKQLIADVSNAPINATLLAKMAVHIANIRVSAQGQAGLKAFLQKIAPHWITPK